MPWTEITLGYHDRRSLRYASDCTDAEWLLIKPFMPARSKVGRPRRTKMRSVWNAIQYIVTDRLLPRLLSFEALDEVRIR